MGVSSGCLRRQVLRHPFLFSRSNLTPRRHSEGILYFTEHTEGCGLVMQSHFFSTEVETELQFERDQPYHDDGEMTKKNATLHHAISRLACDFGKESMLSLRRFYTSRYAPVISTGSLKLDLSLGIGGLPKGRVVEIYGREASGKTTLGLHIVKEAQKLGGYCAYYDLENALAPSLMEAIGIKTEELLLGRPDCAENILSAVDTLVKSGSVDVIVVDSFAALLPRHELHGYTCPGKQSRLMTHALRKIYSSLCRSETLLVFINQVRSNMKAFQSHEDVAFGGNALKFYAAIRLRIMREGLLTNQEVVKGLRIVVQVTKNKLAPAMKKAKIDIGFGKGICREAEVLDIASTNNVILKNGNGYLINGQLFKDTWDAQHYLSQNREFTEDIVRKLQNILLIGAEA